MIEIEDTNIDGVWILKFLPIKDDRGELIRVFCEDELSRIIGARQIKQINQTITKYAGTVRGLHLQNEPFSETKIIRCTQGSVFDVAVDMRTSSPTYLQHVNVTLEAENYIGIVIAEGIAHGFQAIKDNSILHYLHTEKYASEAERGFRYDDPALGIRWPLVPINISERDQNHDLISK
jgi:dTDP-4-dehydrorhamnose 3,5-epimerase